MVQNKKNIIAIHRRLIGRIGWLAGTLLSLILLASCGGEESAGNPENASTKTQLRPLLVEGLKLTREKKYEEATSKVFEFVMKNPKDAEAMAVMSYIYLKSNRLNNAKVMAKRALAIDSYLSRPYIVLARVNFQVSGFEEALDLARKSLVINHDAYEAYQIIGEVYLRQGLIKDGITVLEEAVRLEPENPALLNILGSGYIKDKQYNRALSTLTALQEIDPNNPGAHFNLAVVYARLKQGHKAMRHIAKAEDLYAQDQDNKQWLGKTRDIRRVIAKEFKLRPEDINKGTSKN
jgi:tetratricopeptide (TPR) repeat protein